MASFALAAVCASSWTCYVLVVYVDTLVMDRTYRFLRVALGHCQIVSNSHFLGALFDFAFNELERRILAGSIRRQRPDGPFGCEVYLDRFGGDKVSGECQWTVLV